MTKSVQIAFFCQTLNEIITPPSGRSLAIPVFCLGGHLPQTSARPKQYLPVIFVRLTFIRQNSYERWCRKLLTIEWRKSPFDESKNEDANELWKPLIQSRYAVIIFATRRVRLTIQQWNASIFWQFCFTSPKSLEKSVCKSTRKSKKLTSIRWQQGWRCWRALKANKSSWHSFAF